MCPPRWVLYWSTWTLLSKGCPHHYQVPDIIKRALSSANALSALEPYDISGTDEKRPDGMPIFLWKNGKCLVRDFTCCSQPFKNRLNLRREVCRKKRNMSMAGFTVYLIGDWGPMGLTFVKDIAALPANFLQILSDSTISRIKQLRESKGGHILHINTLHLIFIPCVYEYIYWFTNFRVMGTLLKNSRCPIFSRECIYVIYRVAQNCTHLQRWFISTKQT